MKVINIVLTTLFMVFAYFQLNDPDPWLWVGLYGFAALISAFAVYGKYQQVIISLGMLICFFWFGSLLPDFINWVKSGSETIVGSMKADKPHIELTREFLGLALVLATLGWHLKMARKSMSNKSLE